MGDVSLGLHLGRFMAKRAQGEPVPDTVPDGFPFSWTQDRIAAADLAIANFECVLAVRARRATPNTPLIALSPSAEVLRDTGFDVLSVANNHIFDLGKDGFNETVENLGHAGLGIIGTGVGGAHPEPLLVREVRGIRIGLLSWYVDKAPEAAMMAAVRQADTEADTVVVFMHWGIEDHGGILDGQRLLAHKLVDAGADVVVGGHAHVLQREEWYRDRLVFYGLGNFAFSGMNTSEARRVGALLEVEVGKATVLGARMWRVRLDELGAPRWLDQAPTVYR